MEEMEELVFKYLEANYIMTLSTMVSYKLVDRFDNSNISIVTVLRTINKLFDIEDEILIPIWEKWSGSKSNEINKRITDFRLKIYETTGYNVELTVEDMNKILYGSPDDVFNSTQYDYSMPKRALEGSGKKMQ
jgi:hypothetical protein